MTHRELWGKYAEQLKEANQRIVELETAVAVGEVHLQQVKVAAGSPTSEGPTQQIATLGTELEAKQKRINEQNTAASELATRPLVGLDESDEHTTRVKQLDEAKARIKQLEKDVSYRYGQVCELRIDVGSADQRANERAYKNWKQHVTAAKQNLHTAVSTDGGLRTELETLRLTEGSLRAEIEERDEKLAQLRNSTSGRLRVCTRQTAKDTEITQLKTDVARGKKRR